MLGELARAGETLVAGWAGVALPTIGAARHGALGSAARQGGYTARCLYRAEALLDTAGSRRAQRHVLQFAGHLRGGWRYERLRRGGRSLLRELGAALLAFSGIRWRAGHLTLIFDALVYFAVGLSRDVVVRAPR